MWKLCRYRGSCSICRSWITDKAWIYWEGICGKQHVCEACAEASVSSPEAV